MPGGREGGKENFQRIHQGDQSGVALGARKELSGAAAEVSRNIEGASQIGVGAGGHACSRSTTAQLEKLVPRLSLSTEKVWGPVADPLDVRKTEISGTSRERPDDRHLDDEGTVWQDCC